MHPVIVGIDPGTTAAFAVLSFDFRLLVVRSKKNYPMSEMISDIYKHGNPVLVGTDKKDLPNFIKEFSQKTGAKPFSPGYDTKKGEKSHLVKIKKFSKYVKNDHETDALASAIYAYNDYLSLIKKINSYTDKNNKNSILDKILIKVIQEEKSISKAVDEIEKKPVEKKVKVRKAKISGKKELSNEEKEILLLKGHVLKLKRQIEKEKEKSQSLEKRDIDKEVKKIIAFKEKRALELKRENKLLKSEINRKDKLIDKLNRFIVDSRNKVIIKKLDNLSKEELEKKNKVLNIKKEDVLLVKDISISSDNISNNLKDKVNIIFFETGTPNDEFLFIKKDFELVENKYFALIDKELLDKKIKEALKSKRVDKDYLKNILENYKRERLKEII